METLNLSKLYVANDPRLNVSKKSIDEVYNSSKVLESYMSKASEAVKQLVESKQSIVEYQKLLKMTNQRI